MNSIKNEGIPTDVAFSYRLVEVVPERRTNLCCYKREEYDVKKIIITLIKLNDEAKHP